MNALSACAALVPAGGQSELRTLFLKESLCLKEPTSCEIEVEAIRSETSLRPASQ